MNTINVLVIGDGARESALIWKLKKSYRLPIVHQLTSRDLYYNFNTNQYIINYCNQNNIKLVIPGSEQYLAEGITDDLKNHGINCFGPSKAAAELETSKMFAKDFMERLNINTPKYKVFNSFDAIDKYLSNSEGVINSGWSTTTNNNPIVIKASGLAQGKGVNVFDNVKEAQKFVFNMMNRPLNLAYKHIILEERIYGREVSVMAFSDGYTIKQMIPVHDYKHIYNNDLGPMTGGMGAVASSTLLTEKQNNKIQEILEKTINGMRNLGRPYIGVLYAGIMITPDDEIYVLEYNCRFGDPETQAIIPLMNTDLLDIIIASTNGTLHETDINWLNQHSVAIVAASDGYPGKYDIGHEITLSGVNYVAPLIFLGNITSYNESLFTNGGRVATVVMNADSIEIARVHAYNAINNIKFKNKYYRTDIAAEFTVDNEKLTIPKSINYADCGVCINTADEFVTNIKELVKSTARIGAAAEIGGFSGVFDLTTLSKYKYPQLLTTTDGVGTKLYLAEEFNSYNTIGIDLVAMCVNDILASGGEPICFADYISCKSINKQILNEIIKGICIGCKLAGCALTCGETAVHTDERLNLAGFCTGIVEKSLILPKELCSNDVIIGITSSGVHSNGFSLIRKILGNNYNKKINGKTIAEILLTPTKIYVSSVLPIMQCGYVKAAAHITGGGLYNNLRRVCGNHEIILNKHWPIPDIFNIIKYYGNLTNDELENTFNCGIGFVLVVSKNNVNIVKNMLINANETFYEIGHIN